MTGRASVAGVESRPLSGAGADFAVREGSGASILHPSGDWTAASLADCPERLQVASRRVPLTGLELEGLGRIDTAGVFAMLDMGGLTPQLLASPPIASARPDLSEMAALVSAARQKIATAHKVRPAPQFDLLMRIGERVEQTATDAFLNLAFYGEMLAAVGRLIVRPTRLRPAPTVSLIERVGLDAMPIIAAGNFFVGATIAFLGANLLAQFGASVFAVELVGVSVLREFAVLISAIILAGRSASSFTAEIGAMKMNQEVDAMLVMGVDPFDGLVIPRLIAMLAATPLLTAVGMAAGLAGGLVVIWPVLDLSPQFFLTRVVQNVGLRHFWIGMSKAPVMAIAVAAIGCRHGFAVGGDVEKLGRHVTASVVQSLFAIIVIDAVFALMFLELNL